MDTMTLNPISAPSASQAPVHIQATAQPVNSAPTLHETTAVKPAQEVPKQNGEKGISLDEEKKILKQSTEKFNEMSDKLNLDVKFAYNDKIDQVYLNVIDKKTGQIIRKLPSEEAMKISESMKELVGNLLDKKG